MTPAALPLRVAVNAISLAPGGGMVVLVGLLRGLQRVAPELHATVYASRQPVVDAVRQTSSDIEVIPFALGRSPMRHFLLQQTSLGPELIRRRFDVVLSQGMLVGRCNLPQVVHHQNLYRFQGIPLWRRLTRMEVGNAMRDAVAIRALKHAARNAFISNYLREQAERLVPGSGARNAVVHNGIDQELIDAPKATAGPALPSFEILALQSADKHKDNPTLIRAFAEVVKARPADPWRLTVAGSGNMSEFRNLAAGLGVAQRIRFAGYLSHEELDPLLRRALCLVFTSRLEGFGNPPLEAMARGCPVVASNCTAIPEVVGKAAILVPPGSAEGFARAVLDVAESSDLRTRLIKSGWARVREFSWEASARRMAALLHEAAAG